jgi:uncharacterized protein (DUF433 family)
MLSALVPGQIALVDSLDLERVARDTEERSRKLVERNDNDHGTIVTNRYVFANQPVIAGTRIPTVAIWEFAQAGFSTEEILWEYPRLSAVDVESAIDFEERRRQKRLAS